jgi:hypothetical protein
MRRASSCSEVVARAMSARDGCARRAHICPPRGLSGAAHVGSSKCLDGGFEDKWRVAVCCSADGLVNGQAEGAGKNAR